MNGDMKSKINYLSYDRYFSSYKFDTILGEARVSKSNWRGRYILWTSRKGEFKDDNLETVYFMSAEEAYKKLTELCDAEVARAIDYINFD